MQIISRHVSSWQHQKIHSGFHPLQTRNPATLPYSTTCIFTGSQGSLSHQYQQSSNKD